MSEMDYRSEIDMWTQMWQDMEKSGVHPRKERPVPASYAPDDTTQDAYFNYNDAGEEMFQEQKRPRRAKNLHEQKRQPKAKSQNPVWPDSVGKDQDAPRPAWVNEDVVREIVSLKDRLFKLENKLARLGQGKEGKIHDMFAKPGKVQAEVKELRDRIDRLSDSLGVEDEPTPYHFDRPKKRQQNYNKKPQKDSGWADY